SFPLQSERSSSVPCRGSSRPRCSATRYTHFDPVAARCTRPGQEISPTKELAQSFFDRVLLRMRRSGRRTPALAPDQTIQKVPSRTVTHSACEKIDQLVRVRLWFGFTKLATQAEGHGELATVVEEVFHLFDVRDHVVAEPLRHRQRSGKIGLAV